MIIGFTNLSTHKLKIYDRLNSLIDEMTYDEFIQSSYKSLDYKISIVNGTSIKIIDPVMYDSAGNINTNDNVARPFALCKNIKEFEICLATIYSKPLNELNCYDTVVCICYERCGNMSYVEEISDMFYRMGYIDVIEWEEIINQFEAYNKLKED